MTFYLKLVVKILVISAHTVFHSDIKQIWCLLVQEFRHYGVHGKDCLATLNIILALNDVWSTSPSGGFYLLVKGLHF
jgi:hypothetical protein